MTYAELLAGVYENTNRPDLTAETAAQVKRATMKLHLREYYKQDLKEVAPIVLPVSSTYRYTLDLSVGATYPRYRRVKSLREYNAIPTGLEKEYKEYSADDIFDGYKLERTDYFYIAGTSLQLRTATNTGNVKMIYYQYPDIIPASFTSWIALTYPDAIINEASKNMFKIIGYDEQFQKFEKLCETDLEVLDALGI